MKIIGAILIACGLAMIIYVGYQYFLDKNKVISPIPDEKGIKVIFITPTK